MRPPVVVLKRRQEVLTCREIGERYGLSKRQAEQRIKRQNRKEQKIAAGYELSDFDREVSISSFVAIKALVAGGIGISFLYRSVISGDSSLATFTVEGITEPHPFHVVFTRGTNAGKYSEQFLSGQ